MNPKVPKRFLRPVNEPPKPVPLRDLEPVSGGAIIGFYRKDPYKRFTLQGFAREGDRLIPPGRALRGDIDFWDSFGHHLISLRNVTGAIIPPNAGVAQWSVAPGLRMILMPEED